MADDSHRPMDDLYAGPTFLIRRAHQIATSVFQEACADLDLTPTQYSLLFVLRHRSPVSQNELGRYACLDRATTSLVVRLLRERGLIAAADDERDKRKTLLSLTSAGRLLLGRAEQLSTKASRDLLSVFDEAQARTFVGLLDMLATGHGGRGVEYKGETVRTGLRWS